MAKLFFALKPSRVIGDQIITQRNKLPVQGRLVADANIHLTVLYLGKLSINQQQNIMDCAAKLQQVKFDLQLDCIGNFSHNKITWMGMQDIPQELIDLNQNLIDCGANLNIALEKRRFKPHITLARKSHMNNGQSFYPIPWSVDHFVLLESKQHQGGVYYQVVKEFELV